MPFAAASPGRLYPGLSARIYLPPPRGTQRTKIGAEARRSVDGPKVATSNGSGCGGMRLAMPISALGPRHGTRLIIRIPDLAICLFDQEHDPAFRAFADLDLIAGFPDQIRDVD